MQQLIQRSFKHCPRWLKLKYRKAVNFTCPMCHKSEEIVGKLQIHRKIRGNVGGLYTILPINHPENNCIPLCSICHKKIHQNENRYCISK